MQPQDEKKFAVVLRPGARYTSWKVFVIPGLEEDSQIWAQRDVFDRDTDERMFVGTYLELESTLQAVLQREDWLDLGVCIVLSEEPPNNKDTSLWLLFGDIRKSEYKRREEEEKLRQLWHDLRRLLED